MKLFKLFQFITCIDDDAILQMSEFEIAMLCVYWGALGVAFIAIFVTLLFALLASLFGAA